MHVRSGRVCRFGAFELDLDRRRLTSGGKPVYVPGRCMNILVLLAGSGGQVVPKDALVEAAWDGVEVSDDSIYVAIRELRQILGRLSDGRPYIENIQRLGYQLVPPVEGLEPQSDIDSLLKPYAAFIGGRAALETLDQDAIGRAAKAFGEGKRSTNPVLK